MLDLRRALHAEPGSAEALRLAALRTEDVSAAMHASDPAPAAAPHHHTFDAVMQHHALRTLPHPTVATYGLAPLHPRRDLISLPPFIVNEILTARSHYVTTDSRAVSSRGLYI